MNNNYYNKVIETTGINWIKVNDIRSIIKNK